jgi:N-acetylmuramoyl-L-alanine amidase
MSFSDRELLARIIMCEAGGEGENGMKAVASVLMNRVNSNSGEYFRVSQGGNLRNIIFQEGQFTCASDMVNGKYNSQNLYNMNPTDIHYNIADWALSGNILNEVDTSLWFMNPYKPTCPSKFPSQGEGRIHTRIINHCFYVPTDIYYNT